MATKSIFFIVCFVAVLAGKNCVTCQAQAAVVAELLKLAEKNLAPFQETALKRLHGNIFGNGRATRSTDVVVINKIGKSFKLVSNSCAHGGFTTKLFPEPAIGAKRSSVYGVESHGFATGVECTVKYETSMRNVKKSYFELTTVNPYIGSNSVRTSISKDLRVFETLGTGDNNVVRFIISLV